MTDLTTRRVQEMPAYRNDPAFRDAMDRALAYLRYTEDRPAITFQFAEHPDIWLIGSLTTAAGRNHAGLHLAWSAIDAALSAAQPTPWTMFYDVKRSASKGVRSAGEWVSSFCPALGRAFGKHLHFRGDRLVYEPAPDETIFITRFLSGSSH